MGVIKQSLGWDTADIETCTTKCGILLNTNRLKQTRTSKDIYLVCFVTKIIKTLKSISVIFLNLVHLNKNKKGD